MRIIMGLAVIAVVIFVGCGARNPEAEKAAIEEAERWLTLVDNGQYAESWAEAVTFFKDAISEEAWCNSMQSLRKPLGKKLSREVRSSRYYTRLPGAPDGEYVVVQFRASFENKKSAIETITPMRDEDGKWRVSGYYIK